MEHSVLKRPTAAALLHEERAQYRDIETRLARLDFKQFTAKLYKEGDRSGRLLAWLIREDPARAPIGAIRDPSGQVINSQIDIKTTFAEYYRSLYSEPDPPDQQSINQYVKAIRLPILSLEQLKDLEEPIHPSEIHRAIQQLARGKAPGTDGFPIEYYSAFS